jgi:hypothetical protein
MMRGKRPPRYEEVGPCLLVLVFSAAAGLMGVVQPGPTSASDLIQISTGTQHACVATDGKAIRCCGGNVYGQLGDGGTDLSLTPRTVCSPVVPASAAKSDAGASGVAGNGQCLPFLSVYAGNAHTCAVTVDHGVVCWGLNDRGQLGDGTTTDHHEAVSVCSEAGCSSELAGVTAVAAATFHTCALKDDSGIVCWGGDDRGQLGNGSGGDSPIPDAVCVNDPELPLRCAEVRGFASVTVDAGMRTHHERRGALLGGKRWPARGCPGPAWRQPSCRLR